MEKAPWGDSFGMLKDRYGVDWLVNISGQGGRAGLRRGARGRPGAGCDWPGREAGSVRTRGTREDV